MKDLKLPIINHDNQKNKVLTMEQYLAFIQFNIRNILDKKAYTEQKKMMSVDVPFVL